MRKTEKDIIIQKQDIIATAYRLFSEKGYAATNMEDIAKELGISRTPLYYHFNNKESLFISVIKYYYEIAVVRHKHIFSGNKGIFEKIEEDLRGCYTEKINSLENLLDDIERIEQINPDVKEMHSQYIEEAYKIKYDAVDQAVRNGELRSDTDIKKLVSLIFLGYYCMTSRSSHDFLNITDTDEEGIIKLYIDMIASMYSAQPL